MKYILKIIMLFIAYNGFAQNESKIENSRITTFPNGDEAITIIKDSDTNVIKLISSRDFNEYEMLELSSHEANHRSAKKREIIRTEAESKIRNDQNYAIGKTEPKNKEKRREDKKDSEGA